MSAAKSGAKIRADAAKTVDAVVTGGRSLDAALAVAEHRTRPLDRPLLRMLCYGTLRYHWRLRSFVDALLEKPLKAEDSVIGSLLAVGLYQLTESRVPDHAAVSLTVDAARLLRRPKYAGLINAVLRNFKRKGLQDSEPKSDEVRFNHPAWLIDRLRSDWPDQWEAILDANNARAPMWLRVNRTRIATEDYLEMLANDPGSESSPPNPSVGGTVPGFDQAIRLAQPRPAALLPGFDDGLVSIQDAAAQLAAPWLLASPGARILDACAAPGGKAAQLLELAGPGSSLTAVDLNAERLAATADNLRRLGLTGTLIAGDATTPSAWWDGEPFDRILLDAPCSATGVIRRHPDIKLLRRETDIDSFSELQRRLLEALWPLLAPSSGRLLYVTCSVLAQENEALVGDFLRDCPTADEDSMLHNYNIRDLMRRRACGYQVLPGEQGLDGFYYACLKSTT